MSKLWPRELELEMLNAGPPPEVWVQCHVCQGEGGIEKYEPFDPVNGRVIICENCSGAGGWIEEAS